MAKRLFLTADTDSVTLSDPGFTVFGGTGSQTVKLTSAATGTVLDANIERIELSGDLSAYTFNAVAGTGLQIFSGSTLIGTIGSLNQNATLAFSNGSVALVQTGGTAFTVGGQAVTTSSTAAAITGATVNTSDKSTIALPTFSIAAGAAAVTEATSATFTVTLSSAATSSTSVAIAATGTGGATIGTDTGTMTATGTGVTLAGGILTFAAGSTTATVTLPINGDDTSPETGEGVTVTLSSASSGTAVSATAGSASSTITDAPISYALTTTGTSVDEGANATFTLAIPTALATDKTFTYGVTGTSGVDANDFTGATAGSATITAGNKTATITVAVKADNVAELSENFTVTVKDSTGATVATKSVDITDVTVDLTAPVITTASLASSYPENSAVGATVATLAANETSTFAITSGNDSGYFAIDSATGKVTLTAAGQAAGVASNDFEITPNSFTLGVSATDAAKNVGTGSLVLSLTNVDDDAPTISTATGGATTIALAFNETLSTTGGVPAASAFTGTQTVSGTTTSLNVTGVAINGSTVTLTLGTAIPVGATVSLTYTQPASAPLVDAAGNKAATITKTVSVDTTAPTLSSSTPADNATSVAVADNIVLKFSETVKAGTGNITIVNSGDSTDTRTISVTDSTQVTISGDTVTVNPSADLKSAASYYVNVASTALTDSLGNAFAGISASGTLNFSTPGAGGTPGSSFNLTQLPDTPAMTANDDTVNGVLDSSNPTFQSTDTITDIGGVDTLYALGMPVGATTSLSNVTGVEKLWFNAAANGTATINMGTTSGETLVGALNNNNTTGGNGQLTFNNIGAPSSASIAVTGGMATTTVSFNFDNTTTSGSADTARLTLNGATQTAAGAGTISIDPTNNSIEKLAITTEGSASTLVGTTGLTIGSGVSEISIAGSAKLTMYPVNLGTTVTKVDASQSTGGVVVYQDQAINQIFTGGSGNDVFVTSGTNLASTDVLKGGDGSADFFALSAGAVDSASKASALSQFEGISLEATGLSQDLSYFPVSLLGVGILGTALAGTATYSNAVNNSTLNIGAGVGGALTVSLATNTASDAITLNLGSSTTSSAITLASLALSSNYETVTINVAGSAAHTITAFAASSPNNITFKGTTGITLSSTVNVGGAIDLTGNSANNTVTVTPTTSQTINFGSGNDTLTATGIVAATAAQVINGGAGSDTLSAGAIAAAATASQQQVTLNGEAGDDVLSGAATVGAVAATLAYNGGAGLDLINLATHASNVDTIVSDVTAAANADLIGVTSAFAAGNAFTTATDKFQYTGALSNGTKTSGVSAAILASTTSLNADTASLLSSNLNSTVLIVGFNYAGTELATLATSASTSALSTNYAAFESALCSALGTVAGLDAALTTSDKVLMAFDDGTHSVLVRVTNTDQSTANTLIASELELVGVFRATAALAVADFTAS